MPDSKGKAPASRTNAHAEGDESGDTFESVSFLEDAHALLEKVKSTAENVTTCQVCSFQLEAGGLWVRMWQAPGDEIAYYNNTVRY
jgi:hypothetical protein